MPDNESGPPHSRPRNSPPEPSATPSAAERPQSNPAKPRNSPPEPSATPSAAERPQSNPAKPGSSPPLPPAALPCPPAGELAACRWAFPAASASDEAGIVGVGADLEPATLLAAYSRGLFPMPLRPGGRIAWWSPPERGVLELDDLIVHRSLRRSCRRYEIRVNTAFADVATACADPGRAHGWIDSQMRVAYVRLHRAGFAHSVEAWRGGELAGGLYGVAVGGLFAGESMFHRGRDASKVALVALVDGLRDGCRRLIDVQWPTPHLCSLGVSVIARDEYLRRLPELLASPPPALFGCSQAQPP